MNRYWVSWWSIFDCPKNFPIEVWISGERDHSSDLDNDEVDLSYCAFIESESEEKIWENVEKYFPDYEERFCELKESDWTPGGGGRFIGDYVNVRF